MTGKRIGYEPDYRPMSWIKLERDRKFLENTLKMKYIEELEKEKRCEENESDINDEILQIIPPNPPFLLDDKVFQCSDDAGDSTGKPYSYNDFIKQIEDIAGVNPELLGKEDARKTNRI